MYTSFSQQNSCLAMVETSACSQSLRFFQLGPLYFLLVRYSLSISLRRFLIIEPFRFGDGGLHGRLQASLEPQSSRKLGPYEERIRSKRYCGSCHRARISSWSPYGPYDGIGGRGGYFGHSIRGRNCLNDVVSR